MNPSFFLPASRRPSHRRRLRPLAGACAAALLSTLAACGGGGSDGAGGSGDSIRISEQNAEAIVSNAFRVSDTLYGFGLDASDVSLDLKAAAQRRKPALVDLALQRLDLVDGSATGTARATKGLSSESLPCGSGGSITMTMDDADDSGDVSTGDSAQIDFSNCGDAGWVINGRMSLARLELTGAPGDATYRVGADILFTGFSISDGTRTETVDGGFGIRAALQTAPTRVVESTVSGSFFRVSGGEAGGELRDFNLHARIDASAGTFGYGIAARVTDANGATVVVATPVPFAGAIGSHPSTGSLLVSGGGGSAARLTATSAAAVRIDVDSDGDGVFETSMDRAWEAIAG